MNKQLLLFLAVLFFLSCQREGGEQIINLNKGWSFTQAGKDDWQSAEVPGAVHTDLLRLGEIPDPFYRFNEQKVQWIEEQDWVYRKIFDVDLSQLLKDRVELVFKGLDTYAEVYLNDSLIIDADNMFIPWQAEVKDILRPDSNELRVHFHSPVRIGMEKLQALSYVLKVSNELAPEGEQTNIFTRKAPFHYGWDWGPRLVSSGLWRPVFLRAWDVAHIRDVFLSPELVSEERASYFAKLDVEAEAPAKVELQLQINEGSVVDTTVSFQLETGRNELALPFAINAPQLWWTNGLGEAHLYDVSLTMLVNGHPLQTVKDRLGVRSIELVQEPDSIGRSFYFRLNGVPVFMKGPNYIPSEIFTASQTKDTYERAIQDAVAANMNMLRVWGGAIYEDDEFYDLCDEYGLLVWQDFMFACALTPGDSAYLENVRKEAEYNVRRLRNHPSMALWCGNNENLIAWHNWGWKESYEPDDRDFIWQTYERIFYSILPDAVEKYHPQLSYWASSPSSYGDKLPDRLSGDEHDWTVWFNEAPYENYWNKVPRFVSEYGLQSFPPMKTIHAFADTSDLSYRSLVMEHRQRSNMPWIGPGVNGNEMIRRYLLRYYRAPKDFESFVYVSQLSQALGMKTAAEAHRGSMPRCMGSLYWQLNDCWPTMSWSSTDYFGRWKASHYAFREAFKKIHVIPHEENDLLQIRVVSDQLEPQPATLTMRLIKLNGKVLWEEQAELTLVANTADTYYERPVEDFTGGLNSGELVLQLQLSNQRGDLLSQNLHYFVRPKELDLPAPGLSWEVAADPQGYLITLRTGKLAKDVYLRFPEAEGDFVDNFFDLLPGESRTLLFKTEERIDDPMQALRVMTLYDSYTQVGEVQ